MSLIRSLIAVLLIAGCATTPVAPPSVNVTGHWTGTFEGKGFGMSRSGVAEADFAQNGANGTGTMRFDYGPGATPQPVLITVAGNQIRAEHRNGLSTC
jgi:hypothetical protein